MTGASVDLVRVSGLAAFEGGWFSFGTIDWTSGVSIGRSYVLTHAKGSGGVDLTLQLGDRSGPVPGDTFIIRAGCDKTFATCKSKFSNALSFQGFPHLPGNDAAYGYVVDGAVFDGAPLTP